MHSPFATQDPIVRKAGIVLTLSLLMVFFLVVTSGVAEAKTQTLETSVVTPAKTWYLTQMNLMSLEIVKISREQQERAIQEQQQLDAQRLHQEFLRAQQLDTNVSVTTETTIINNGATIKKQKSVQTKPQNSNSETIQMQPEPQGNSNPPANTGSYTFDQAAWDAEIAKMKADAEARYQQSLQDQQVWSNQKSAENAAWMDEQRAKAEDDQAKWRVENGL